MIIQPPPENPFNNPEEGDNRRISTTTGLGSDAMDSKILMMDDSGPSDSVAERRMELTYAEKDNKFRNSQKPYE
ncbi:unnamed protein product [Penicillium pancosmium]